MPLIASLDQILEWHRRNNTPAARLLQPGLSEDEIMSRMQALPFHASRELVELYRWHNGTAIGEEGEDTSLFEIHRFLPLEEAVSSFRESPPEAQALQIFRDEALDGYAVSGAAQMAERSAVVLMTEGEVQKVFSSLTKMMQTVAAAFEEGAMGWEDEEMETDFFAWGGLAHRIDPHIEYWKDYLAGEA